MKKFLQEVHTEILKIPAPKKPTAFEGFNYIGAGKSKLQFLDIQFPILRKRLKQGFSFSHLSSSQQIKIWDYIIRNTKTFEVMMLSLMWLKLRTKDEILEFRDFSIEWLLRCDNWAISDSLSDFYAFYLEEDKKFMLPLLKTWRNSPNPWVRRQSLVSLMYYSRLRRRVLSFKEIKYFLNAHLNDEHYYVQKGLGWALRESYNIYPIETLAFLKKNVKKISSTAWVAATEKLSKPTKSQLILARKRHHSL